MRRSLRGETFVPVAERLEVLGSRPHGHVQAVRVAMQRLGIELLIGTRASPERERILALIAARVLAPHTRLARLMTTRDGCPISVSVYEGNTSDTKTLMPQVMKLKESFDLERVVLVGDRGMISHKAIGELKDIDGLAWITALKRGQIRGLVEAGALQLGLFDEVNLFEFSDPKYPMSGSLPAVIHSLRSFEHINAKRSWKRPHSNSIRSVTASRAVHSREQRRSV